MDLKTILVATDFSPPSDHAMQMAALIARGQNAKLIIVHVLDLPVAYSESPLVYTFATEEVASAERELAKAVPSDPLVVCEHKLLKGDTAACILQAADDFHVDLIVLGTHGHTGAMHVLGGSVAEKVLRHATCPVLAVKAEPSTQRASEKVGETSCANPSI
jgi:nucleotide-binding universal stress UspA family protein